jgi:long-chain acyl-CoA synthetase
LGPLVAGIIRPHCSRSITISDGIFASASRTPGKVAIREGKRALTYAQLAERTVQVANVVHGHFGLVRGDRAAVFMPNRIEYLEIVCGMSSAGVAACTIGPAASPAEIRFICEDASARVLFVAPELEEIARAAAADIVPDIVVLDQRYEDLLAQARSDSLPVETDWEDIFSIPYTSGATGRPKGVMLSHRARVLSSYAMASEHGCYGPDDRAVATTPMFHGSGFLMVLAPLFFGGFVELLPSFNIEQLMLKIQETAATSVYMVPTHFSSLFAMGERRHAFNHSSLKCVIVGTYKYLLGETRSPVRTYVSKLTSVEVSAPNTVRFVLSEPFAPFDRQVSLISIISQRAFEDIGAAKFALAPVGSGPFKVVRWVKDDRVELAAFDDYWAGAPRFGH